MRQQRVQSEFARLIKAGLPIPRLRIQDKSPMTTRSTAEPPIKDDVRLVLQTAVRFVDEAVRITKP